MAATPKSRQSGNGVLTSEQILAMDPNHPQDLALLVERYQVLYIQRDQSGLSQSTKADEVQAEMTLIREVLQKKKP